MIIVDVEVPSIERKYQFSVEEHIPVDTLIAELVEIICQKEQCRLKGNAEELCLCSSEGRKILNYQSTLAQQGITNADCLLLI